MEAREAKDKLYEAFASTARALASPKRIEIIELLAQAEYTVEAIAKSTNMTIANTSAHLKVLKHARIVVARREGTKIFYKNASLNVSSLLGSLRELTQSRIAEVNQVVADYFSTLDAFEPLSRDEFIELTRSREVIVLDVRPELEYTTGHIPGALSVPLEQISAVANSLPKSSLIVAYCRGPFCVLAPQAVDFLTRHGFNSRRLHDGMPEWRLAGFPVEVS